MGRDRLSARSFALVDTDVRRSGGPTTAKGEQRHREGKGLDPLVDPKGFGVIRRSLSWFEPQGKKDTGFFLLRGTAMLVEDRWDTTGSMGGNVEIAFEALPRSFKLMAEGKLPVLGRYDLQMITSIFGDVQDYYVLCRSQAELDERIAEQMRLMVPEKDGGDADEDPQYGLFGAAYLTDATIVKLGLKTYDFTTTDARGRSHLDLSTLKRVFGDEVLDKVQENGHQMSAKKIPSTDQVVEDLLKRSHAFLLQVGSNREVTTFWKAIYGAERIIKLPRTELLPEVRAAIIGLTEGVINLQNVSDYLMDQAEISKKDAEAIRDAVAEIPLCAQAALPNFKKIPLKGAKFAKKGDLWPIGFDENGDPVKPGAAGSDKKPTKSSTWL